MTQSSQFQPRQILCLEHGQSRLYAEVIQVVPDRPVCWLRPLILEIMPPHDLSYVAVTKSAQTPETDSIDRAPSFLPTENPDLPSPLAGYQQQNYPQNYQPKQAKEPQPKTYDLRLSSDLLMPPVLFRPAFDTELIPLLGQINSSEFSLGEAQTAHHLLRDFIQQVWQNHREVFPS